MDHIKRRLELSSISEAETCEEATLNITVSFSLNCVEQPILEEYTIHGNQQSKAVVLNTLYNTNSLTFLQIKQYHQRPKIPVTTSPSI